jgi:hypothetical protein
MKRLIAISGILLLAACQNEPSLQRYFVDKSEDARFMALDLPPSILNIKGEQLSAEEKQALESFRKLNVLVYQNKPGDTIYETEKNRVKDILKNPEYQQLLKVGQGQDGASVSFVGDENHIDEFILFANRRENGFAVVRVLGKDMNPTGVFTLLKLLKKSNLNAQQLQPLQQMLPKDKT